MLRKSFFFLALCAFWLQSPGHSKADPAAFVQQLSDSVVAVLNDEALPREAKLAELKTLLDEAADLELLGKLILGRYWRSASPAERSEYTVAFRKLVNQTMASRLGDYGGETIEVVGSQPLNERDTMVSTLVNRTDGGPAYKVDWRVRETEGRPAVIDVVAEGVSLVVTQRSEIGEIASRQGMQGLIEQLQSRLEAQQ